VAKRTCLKKGRNVLGHPTCRKYSGSKKHSKGHRRPALATPGLGKAIRGTAKKRCSNPVRSLKALALVHYIRGAAELEIEKGVPALGKGVVRRRLKGLHSALTRVAKVRAKCRGEAA
jgi:hypothetical protein